MEGVAMREFPFLIVALAAGAASGQTAWGQTKADRPAFELADIHASPKTQHPSMRSGMLQPGIFQLRMATMLDLISTAYGVEGDKVTGGPSWLELDRFDILAKFAPGAPLETVRVMLQSLLQERFGLVVHKDIRLMQGFALSLGKNTPKMRRAEASERSGCRRAAASEPEANAIECRSVSLAEFAQQLSRIAGDYLPARVMDDTRLTGAWDFALQWTPRGGLAAAGPSGRSIFDAVQNQLGLKLEPKQVDTPVLVVDRVNRTATPNSRDAAGLPVPPPPVFEVATVKPSSPQQAPGIQTPPNGQVNLQGLTLGFLIQTIWFVTPDMIVGAPKWLDDDRWDISAKIASAPGSGPVTDMDSLIAMVRGLLEERFQLKTHLEQQTIPAYTLTSLKPKLQPADPTGRTGCKEGPVNQTNDPRIAHPALSRLASCRNITMAEFAEMLPNIANALSPPSGGYLRSAVADATGLSGAYDFSLNFSPWSLVQNATADPNGAISLFDAIREQLGLKLELTKRPASVLVIDHIERQPSAN